MQKLIRFRLSWSDSKLCIVTKNKLKSLFTPTNHTVCTTLSINKQPLRTHLKHPKTDEQYPVL